MAGFLIIWLKRCVLPAEKISANVIFPAVLLCFNHGIALLPTIMANIHRGLIELVSSFTAVHKKASLSKAKKPQRASHGSSGVAGGEVEVAATSKRTIPRVE